MRLLMVTDFYWPFMGGVEQHVRSLSTALVARGHEVAVATLRGDDAPPFEDDQGVRVHRITGSMQRLRPLFKNPGRPWAAPFPDPEALLAIRRVIAAERPDIVHGHDWLMRSFLPLKPTSGAKAVMSLHYYTLSCAKKSLMYQEAPCSGPAPRKCLACASDHYGPLKGRTVTLGNWACGAAERALIDLFLPVSVATAEGNGLVGSGLPYRVIPNFLRADSNPTRADLAPYLAELPAEPYLLFVGDLRRFKGLDTLLEAYRGLEGAPPLVLIGKVWPETPEHFPPNVLVRRNWPNFAVMEAWRRSLFALVPSLWPEPFGIVVIEAMSAGRPVVASNIGGIPEMVTDGETGLLVAPGDAEALRGAMARLLADPALRARLGQGAALRARDFQASAVVPQIERLYAELLAPAPRPVPESAGTGGQG